MMAATRGPCTLHAGNFSAWIGTITSMYSLIKGDGDKKCSAPEVVRLQNLASFKKTVLFVEVFLCFQNLLLTLQVQLLFFFCVFALLHECKHFSFINSLQSTE